MRTFFLLILFTCFTFSLHAQGFGGQNLATDTPTEAAAINLLSTHGLTLSALKAGTDADLYGTITNGSDVALQLNGISSPVAQQVVMLPAGTDPDAPTDTAASPSPILPAHGSLPSGGQKIRLLGLNQDLEAGMSVPLELHFAQGTTTTVNAIIVLSY